MKSAKTQKLAKFRVGATGKHTVEVMSSFFLCLFHKTFLSDTHRCYFSDTEQSHCDLNFDFHNNILDNNADNNKDNNNNNNDANTQQ